jgi:hypothetical protein
LYVDKTSSCETVFEVVAKQKMPAGFEQRGET